MKTEGFFKVHDAKCTLLENSNINDIAHLKHIKKIFSDDQGFPIQAKRASKVSKSALSHMAACERSLDFDYTIFISRFGELPFIEKNNEDNAALQELSPTCFSHSVHNALACLYSIIANNKAPSTSLATNGQMIKTGILEAISYLNAHREKTHVLIVIYDSNLPDRYSAIAKDTPNNFILSFVVSNHPSSSLNLQKIMLSLEKAYDIDDELFVLDQFCSESNNQYREIQRIYDTQSQANSGYLTEYYL